MNVNTSRTILGRLIVADMLHTFAGCCARLRQQLLDFTKLRQHVVWLELLYICPVKSQAAGNLHLYTTLAAVLHLGIPFVLPDQDSFIRHIHGSSAILVLKLSVGLLFKQLLHIGHRPSSNRKHQRRGTHLLLVVDISALRQTSLETRHALAYTAEVAELHVWVLGQNLCRLFPLWEILFDFFIVENSDRHPYTKGQRS